MERRRILSTERINGELTFLRLYINILLDDHYSKNTQWYNWCYWDETTRTVLLTDFKKSNAEFNRFKKHLRNLLGPKAKIQFCKHQDKKENWWINILVRIKN